MATIRKRTRLDGRAAWQVDYRDAAGKRRHRQFTTRRDADAFLIKARAEVVAGTHTPDSASITVREAADIWIARCEVDGLERTTLLGYCQHVKLHILPLIGGVRLARLTVPAIHAFADHLRAQDRSRDMVKRVLGSLSAIVTTAQQRGLVAVNNVRKAAPDSVRRLARHEDVRPAMPTREELRAIINATPDRSRPLILTAIFTGLRASELRGLTWANVDLKAGELHVRRRVDRFGKFGPPKSKAGTRDIPLSPMLLNTLKAWKLACPAGELDLIFPTGAGNVESHGNILSRVFWPIQIAAGVVDASGDAKYSLHALRHAAAALWIEQGLGPKRIQMLMGHSSIQQTFDTYGYLLDTRESDQNAMAEIEVRLLS
jgi:integrase